MFAALAVLTGWRGPEAKQLLSSIPVGANRPSYSHTLHSHVLLTRLDLYPLSCWGLQPQLSSSKRPESHQEPDEPDFTFPVDIIFFIIFINFSLLLFSEYIRAVRILKGNLVVKRDFQENIIPENPTNIMPVIVAHAPETCKRCCLILFVAKLRRLYFLLYEERFNRGRFSVS